MSENNAPPPSETTTVANFCEFAFSKFVGFEWVRPNEAIAAEMRTSAFDGIAIKTSAGPLVLAKVEIHTSGMESRFVRTCVRAHQLNTADC